MPKLPKIYVDADACPVKGEVLRLADRAGLVVVLVANSGLRPSRDPMVQVKIVPQGPDVADDWIVQECGDGDIVITADIELAQRALVKGAFVLNHNGQRFEESSIGMAMGMRDLNRELRETGAISGHSRPFDGRDRNRFTQALADAIQLAKR